MNNVIKFETNRGQKLITPCPHNTKYGKETVNVGSTLCENCINFVKIDTHKKIVVCDGCNVPFDDRNTASAILNMTF